MRFILLILLIILTSKESRAQSYYLDATESELMTHLLDHDVKGIFRGMNSGGIFINWSDSALQMDITAFFKDGAVNKATFLPFHPTAKENFKKWLNSISSNAIKMTDTDWKFYYDDKKLGVIQEKYDETILRFVFIILKM